MTDTAQPLAVGDTLHGFCSGAFGRDHYDCCTIEAIGPNWLVTRDAHGELDFTCGQDTLNNLRAHRQPTTDVNGDPCCQQPTLTVRYMPTWHPHPADCPDCVLAAAASPVFAAELDRLLAANHGDPGPAFTNPTPPTA